jgi:hypothetical protein
MGDDVLTAPLAWEAYDTLRRNAWIVFAPEPPEMEVA